jgi:hypothetical protein
VRSLSKRVVKLPLVFTTLRLLKVQVPIHLRKIALGRCLQLHRLFAVVVIVEVEGVRLAVGRMRTVYAAFGKKPLGIYWSYRVA